MSRGRSSTRSRPTSSRACARSANAARAPVRRALASRVQDHGHRCHVRRRRAHLIVGRHQLVPTFRFVGGKGGVGKTTCAAALGCQRRPRRPPHADRLDRPAPSLGDALRQPLGAAPRPVQRRQRISHAVEVDAPAALDRWLASAAASCSRRSPCAAPGSTRDDVARLLRLSLPGIDEIAGLLRARRLRRQRHATSTSSSTPRRPGTCCACWRCRRCSSGWPRCSTACRTSTGSWSTRCAAAGHRMPPTR